MPFLIVVADHNDDELFRGPTFFGDRNLEQEIVTNLDGAPSRNEDDDIGSVQPFYETTKSPGQVLNILENHGFRVVGTSSTAGGEPATFVWTLHKNLLGKKDDSVDIYTSLADSEDDEPSKFSVQFMKLRDVQESLNALSNEDTLQSDRLNKLIADLEKLQASIHERTARTDAASEVVDEYLSRLASNRAMTTEKADSLVLDAKLRAASAKPLIAEDESQIKFLSLWFQVDQIFK